MHRLIDALCLILLFLLIGWTLGMTLAVAHVAFSELRERRSGKGEIE